MIVKRFMILGLVCAVAGALAAQSGSNSMTVEQSYLQETVEMMVIRDASQSGSREMKLVALEYISNALDRGSSNPEIHAALELLSLEGIRNQSRESGRLVNNFPDVRQKAATFLGRVGTPEARATLIRMSLDESEPAVITEAIKSLGLIGLNDNNETVDTIVWLFSQFHYSKPDNLLALSILDAFERISATTKEKLSTNAVQVVIRIAESNYVRPVKDRAKAMLSDMMSGGN